MSLEDGYTPVTRPHRAPSDRIREFVTAALVAAGTDPDVARSVAVALTETSLRGVESHGIRLLVSYVNELQNGSINARPKLAFTQTGPGAGIVNADNGFGHHASFFAIEQAAALARQSGTAAVSVINSSHFGAAGCYVLQAAERGFVALGVCNANSFVLPHDGVKPFHGTNPLAFAAPVSGARPFLLDMATSVIPWNRVQNLLNQGLTLPPDVAVDRHGAPTREPGRSVALLPLGGISYGYKGAALASMIEVLSAVMTGMPHCSQLPNPTAPDLSAYRRLGHFFLLIDPARFLAPDLYTAGMKAYLSDLRAQPGRQDSRVMAPGDREWAVERERQMRGIPVVDHLKIALDELADRLSIQRLDYL